MSKSIGNVIAPAEVIKESGAESLRLWVASSDFREELRVGKQILQRVVEAYRKIRNTCRYLLANLYDFDPARDKVPLAEMQEVDRYALARYAEVAQRVLAAYDSLRIPGIFQRLNQLTTVDLSAFYADVSKDRPVHVRRRVAGKALGADGDVRHGRRPGAAAGADPSGDRRRDVEASAGERARLRFTSPSFPGGRPQQFWTPALVRRWERLIEIRNVVNAALEVKRQDKTIGTSLGAHASVCVRAARPRGCSNRCRDELPMLFIVSQLDSTGGGDEARVEVSVKRADGDKCPRCWRVVPTDVRATCDDRAVRCAAATQLRTAA